VTLAIETHVAGGTRSACSASLSDIEREMVSPCCRPCRAVGTKVALSILSTLTPGRHLASAIRRLRDKANDHARAPASAPKVAERGRDPN